MLTLLKRPRSFLFLVAVSYLFLAGCSESDLTSPDALVAAATNVADKACVTGATASTGKFCTLWNSTPP